MKLATVPMDMDNAAHIFQVGDVAHLQIGTDLHAVKVTHVYVNGRRIVTADIHGGTLRWFSLRKDNVWRHQGDGYRLRPGHRHQMDTTR